VSDTRVIILSYKVNTRDCKNIFASVCFEHQTYVLSLDISHIVSHLVSFCVTVFFVFMCASTEFG